MGVKLLCMDVDGTLTDGKIYMSAQGELFKAFDVKDGYGIRNLLPKAGIVPVIITGRTSQIVTNRCKELGIQHIYQGCEDKAAKLEEVADQFGLNADEDGIYREIAYVGDDLNDLEPMKLAGYVMCPADACQKVAKAADYVSPIPGGSGAVRDAIEHLLEFG